MYSNVCPEARIIDGRLNSTGNGFTFLISDPVL